MPSDFLTSTLPYLIIVAVSVLGLAYAGYLALSVYRGLSSPTYKSRALWTGVLAIVLALTLPVSGNVSILFPGSYYVLGIVLSYGVLYPVAIFGLYAWIDRTITTLIHLDFLRRDLARWRRFRWVYWGLAAIQFVLYFGQNAPVSPLLGNILGASYLFFLLVPATYGALTLLIGSRKTADMTFKLHAKWIGYTIGAIILIAVVDTFTHFPPVAYAPYLLIAYCYYKVVVHLVPVGRFRTD